MPPKIQIQEQGRDDDFGIMRKEVRFSAPSPIGPPSIETPTKAVKNPSSALSSISSINEVVKKIFPRTLDSIWNATDSPSRSVKSHFLPNKLNLSIFEIMLDRVPDKEKLRSLTSYWYAASQSVLFLPTVSSRMLKDEETFSEKKVTEYVDMLRYMIETTLNIGNNKTFIGTVPLLSPRLSSMIVRLYLDKGFNAFAIDAGTKDILYHEPEFRSILAQINEQVSLSKAFVYACNLGIPQFDKYKARADDFLSLFAYVDVFGGTFKTRGGPGFSFGKSKVKKFLRSELRYEHLYTEKDRMNDFNQREQVIETNAVRPLIGVDKIQKYLDGKEGVDSSALKRLGSIAKEVKGI
jgi:hypothetical protein